MKKILLLSTLLLSSLSAYDSNVQTYIESLNFKDSVQKTDGTILGVGASIKTEDSLFKFSYEHGDTNTIQPPLDSDLKVDKLFLKYDYSFNSKWNVNFNYLNVLNDNIAITSHGKAYGLGITYKLQEQTALNLTQFLSDYKDFNVNQTDISLNHKMEFGDMKIKLTAIAKILHLKDKESNGFSKFAKDDYTSVGFKLHSHYQTCHFGFGGYYGKRVFAIMNDGFKMQHHAMEFDRTLSIGAGKTFDALTLKVQYIYQRAIELPVQNGKKVDIKNTRIMANYKF